MRLPPLALLCAVTAANTVAIGAFPPLLPELQLSRGLSDRELGAVAGMFGFARMIGDLPIGLLVRRHVRGVLLVSPLAVAAGIVCVASAGPLWVLLAGRALMGVGHALGMVGALTAVLRHHAGPRLGSALNAFELSGMLGLLIGVTLLGAVPERFPWSSAFVMACAPQLAAMLSLPWLLASLREREGRASIGGPDGSIVRAGGPRLLLPVAFAAGALIAITYSTIEQFVVPLRAHRQFGLDRGGIATLLQVMQIADLVALLPAGRLADRVGAARVLGAVAIVMALGTVLIGFGPLPLAAGGCVIFGLAMAGWMLPLGVVRGQTPASKVAWRTALYRVGVDGGIFLGPFASGMFGERHAAVLPGLLAAALLGIGVVLIANSPRPGRAA